MKALFAGFILSLAGFVLAASPSPKEPLKLGSPPPYRPRGDQYLAGPVEIDHPATKIEQVLPPFPMPNNAKTPQVVQFVFFAKRRPVRMELTILREGEPLSVSWQRQFEKLFRTWDRDRDGLLNKYELENIYGPASFRQLFSGSFYSRVNGSPLSLSILDLDKDHRVSLAELTHHYWPRIRDEIVRTKVLPVASATETRTEELFDRLDLNRDGKLSEEELGQAEQLLQILDSDEDECLSSSELLAHPLNRRGMTTNPEMQAMNTMNTMNGSTRSQSTEVVRVSDVHLYPEQLPPSLTKMLLQRYDHNKNLKLSRQELGWTEAEFNQHDTNHDNELSLDELDQWRTRRADVTLQMDYHPQAIASRCRVVGAVPNWLTIQPTSDSTRFVGCVGSQTIDLMIRSPSSSMAKQTARNFVNSVLPEGVQQLREGDLTGPQYQYIRLIFEAADTNHDGILTRQECLNYFELQREVAEFGLVMTTAVRTPDLFELLDENRDGKLSVRELRTAWGRLRPLEPGQSLVITRAIFQPCVNLRLMSGPYLNSDNESNSPALDHREVKSPVWFLKMDRNHDGDVSLSEFIGTREDFDRLDSDGDQLISLAEAMAYEAKVRPKKK